MKSFYGKPKKPSISIECFALSAVHEKAKELAKEHIYCKMIDDGYDPFEVPNQTMAEMISAFLYNSKDIFFEKAREAIARSEKAKH